MYKSKKKKGLLDVNDLRIYKTHDHVLQTYLIKFHPTKTVQNYMLRNVKAALLKD